MSRDRSKRKIRLALITTVIDGRTGRGTARVAEEILARLLMHTDIFEFTLIHHEPSDNPIYQQHRTLLIPHLPAPFDRHLLREAVFWIRLFFSNTRFDIAHYLNPRVWPSYLLTPAKHIVITVHEAGIMRDLHTHGAADRVFQFTNRFLNMRMDHLIAVSEFGRQEISTYFKIPSSRIAVIYNALPASFTNNHPEKVRADLGLPPSYMLSVGRLDPHKNILRLLEAYAIARSRGVHEPLVLVGGAHLPKYSTAVLEAIERLDLTHEVFRPSIIPDHDLPDVYRGARALVYPSLHEGFGMPLLEAMASGTPIACSNTTALPEIAKDAALLFNPESVPDIADALCTITSDAQLRENLVTRGFARVQDFSWEQSVTRLIALYRSQVPDGQ